MSNGSRLTGGVVGADFYGWFVDMGEHGFKYIQLVPTNW